MRATAAAITKSVNWMLLAIVQAVLFVVQIGLHHWHGAYVAAVFCAMNLLLWSVTPDHWGKRR